MGRSAAAFAMALLAGCTASVTAGEAETRRRLVGFGAETSAGRGGKVIRVTNLDSEGPGSLRAALETGSPRTIVFEVGGVIDLGKRKLSIKEPFVTVAGQTAPAPGITVIRGGIYITTHDVVIRHIRVRPGDAGEPKRSGWEPDGISTSGGDAHDVLIDQCSVTWAVDENLSASGPRTEGPDATSHRITFSNCIIAECLSNSTHAKGEHSKGSLIHDFCRDIAIVGNLYAHNTSRNPYFKAHTTGVVVNNLIYNPGWVAVQVGYVSGEWQGSRYKPENCRVSVVGNVLHYGKNTRSGVALVGRKSGDAYLEDNLAFDRSGREVPIRTRDVTVLDEKPSWPEGLVALPAIEVADHVLKHAGARPRERDEVDSRIVREFRERKGRIIDSQDEVDGYPKHELTRRRLDVPARWTPAFEAWLAKLAADLE
ncbi:MAG: pectate lyase family protein [Planctomycetota bacterium]